MRGVKNIFNQSFTVQTEVCSKTLSGYLVIN